MLEKLGNALKKSIDKISSALFVDKKLIEEIVRDLQRELIQADVNVSLVKQLSDKIKKEAESNLKGIEKKEHIIKILHDSLLELLGGEKKELEIKDKQKIMLVGLYGSGKTTTITKLANYYAKRGKKTCILGLDVHRPAAPEQLEQLSKKANLPCFIDKNEKSALKIWKKYKKETEKFDLTFIDTAGRDVLDKPLIKEIKELDKEISPSYTLLVIPADIGQAAKKQAEELQKACKINGVIITRMDSSARGGGAITACNETKAPVFFITTGEKIQDIEPFNPLAFISRILGMGDLESLLEKIRSVVDEKEQEKLRKKLKEGKFDLMDMYEQIKAMSSMGSLSKIASLIPGLGKAKIPDKLMDSQEERVKKWKYAIESMTKEERENPELIEKQTSRLQRIAKGSGTHTSDIRALIKQYKILKEFTKSGDIENMQPGNLSQKQMMKLAKKFGKKIRL